MSSSLGLVVAPRIRFLKRQMQPAKAPIKARADSEADDDQDRDLLASAKPLKSSKMTPFQKKLALLAKKDDPINFAKFDEECEQADDMLFTVKRVELSDNSDDDEEIEISKKAPKVKTKASMVKKLRKKNIKINEKVTFDEEGNVRAGN